MNAATRKPAGGAGGTGRGPALVLAMVAVGVFLISYNFFAMVFRGAGSGLPAAAGTGRDPVVAMPAWTRAATGDAALRRPFHVALTATDTPYSRWQCRVMYYWYKRMQARPGGEAMGGFTRVLHSGEPDGLMDEIPTFVVDPLPDDHGIYPAVSWIFSHKRVALEFHYLTQRNYSSAIQSLRCHNQEYVVLNRPWAFVQWLQKAKIKEEYILMAEPDHIFVKPLPNLAHDNDPAAFPFFYILPSVHENIIRKYYPEERGPVNDIDPIGNSPVIIKKTILEKIAPTWMNVSIQMKEDKETDETFGWVLEMYAYAVASALHGVHHILRKDFMIQPPFDPNLENTFIIHYTYGNDYSLKGEMTYGKIGEWRFDKRSFLDGPPPRNLTLPPPGVPESVVTLVKMVNEASANLPRWDDGI